MIDFFLVAQIIAIEGDKGFLKIESYADSPERFYSLKKVYLDFWGEKKMFSLQFVKRKKENIIIKFRDFDDKVSVEMLVGKDVFIDSGDLIQLPEGRFYIHDIVGCKVTRNNVELGKVVDVYSLNANDVYVIRKVTGEEILIPAVREFIDNVNIANKVIVLKPGEDFYEDDEN